MRRWSSAHQNSQYRRLRVDNPEEPTSRRTILDSKVISPKKPKTEVRSSWTFDINIPSSQKQVNMGGKFLLKRGKLMSNPLTSKLGMKKRKLVVEIHSPVSVTKKDTKKPDSSWPEACFQNPEKMRSSYPPKNQRGNDSQDNLASNSQEFSGVDVNAMMSLLSGMENKDSMRSLCDDELRDGETAVFRVLRSARNKKELAKAKPLLNDEDCSDDEGIDEQSVSSVSTIGFQGADEALEKGPELWIESSTFSVEDIAYSKRHGIVYQMDLKSERLLAVMQSKPVSKFFVFKRLGEAMKFENIVQSLNKSSHSELESNDILATFSETDEEAKEAPASPKWENERKTELNEHLSSMKMPISESEVESEKDASSVNALKSVNEEGSEGYSSYTKKSINESEEESEGDSASTKHFVDESEEESEGDTPSRNTLADEIEGDSEEDASFAKAQINESDHETGEDVSSAKSQKTMELSSKEYTEKWLDNGYQQSSANTSKEEISIEYNVAADVSKEQERQCQEHAVEPLDVGDHNTDHSEESITTQSRDLEVIFPKNEVWHGKIRKWRSIFDKNKVQQYESTQMATEGLRRKENQPLVAGHGKVRQVDPEIAAAVVASLAFDF
mmetsp:Transcript_31458/g.41928  ORF Transcript_31458/g.41928 Transcript_31458/m.41928 type:complete len:615 (-) Transcript_31458:315-2159(-)